MVYLIHLQWTLGAMFLPMIQWPIDLLNKIADKIDHWRRRQSSYYNAKRFFQDSNRMRIPGISCCHSCNVIITHYLLEDWKKYEHGGVT